MTIKKTPKENRYFVMSVLKEISLNGVSYSLANFNGAVDTMGGSLKNKTDAKDIAAEVFDRGKLHALGEIMKPYIRRRCYISVLLFCFMEELG